jgi:glyoxylase-like metal-dependent hydrolase (beta-lactamase superfamily II)
MFGRDHREVQMKSAQSTFSRRKFFRAAGGAAALGPGLTAPASSQSQRPAGEAAASELKKLSENLYYLEDTCNVYLIRNRDRAVLIDFGSGQILDHLAPIGVTRVDWILHTHHHRDQCQGDQLAAARKIPIAVPAHEHHLFADVENFWRNRRVFHEGYETRNDYFSLTASIPVAARLHDYERFECGGLSFFVLPTPGHTLGSVTLLIEVDGRKAAFCGDLLHSPGKILTLYDLQYHYGNYEGLDFSVFSLDAILEEKPELLCPSHGQPLTDPAPAIRETMKQLAEYHRFITGQAPTIENLPYAVSPHLIASNRTSSTFYAILSESGKAMFIDYGFPSVPFSEHLVKVTAVNDRSRFVEHNIKALKSRFGLKSIDVAMPTHMNDDHYSGFHYLKRHHGTKIWCYESMVEVFENPGGDRLGCIVPEPLKVDRAFRHEETFQWEEYEFLITHNPGHAEHQMALFVTIDGQRVGFTGDAYSFSPDRPTPDGSMHIRPVFLNRFESDSYQKSIRNLIKHRPDILAPGHGRPFPLTDQMIEATKTVIDKHAEFYRKLIADPDCDFGLDATWVRLYPYQMFLRAGEPAAAEIRVRNYRARTMKIEVALVLPGGWSAEPGVLNFEAPPQGRVSRPFRLTPARDVNSGARLAIAVDVKAGGKHLGQIAEAIVNIA